MLQFGPRLRPSMPRVVLLPYKTFDVNARNGHGQTVSSRVLFLKALPNIPAIEALERRVNKA